MTNDIVHAKGPEAQVSLEDFLAWERASRDCIDVKRVYIDLMDDVLGGVMLSQIVYWHLPARTGESKLRPPDKDGHQWLVKARFDWWDECRIKPKQVDRLLDEMVERGFVVKKVVRFNGTPTTHLYLVWDVLLKKLGELVRNPLSNPYSQNGKIDGSDLVLSETPEVELSSLYKNTPKSTAESPMLPKGIDSLNLDSGQHKADPKNTKKETAGEEKTRERVSPIRPISGIPMWNRMPQSKKLEAGMSGDDPTSYNKGKVMAELPLSKLESKLIAVLPDHSKKLSDRHRKLLHQPVIADGQTLDSPTDLYDPDGPQYDPDYPLWLEERIAWFRASDNYRDRGAARNVLVGLARGYSPVRSPEYGFLEFKKRQALQRAAEQIAERQRQDEEARLAQPADLSKVRVQTSEEFDAQWKEILED